MSRFGSLRKRLMIAAGAGLITTFAAIPASAAPQTSADQCLLTVTGKDANNQFTTKPMKCFSTFAEVMRATGAKDVSDKTTPATAKSSGMFLSGSVIGVHFEFAGGGGATLTVNGTTCTGGGLNVPLAWNDRISSTMNGCPSIVHYEHTNYTGASSTTFGSGSIHDITGYMDNRTSSILYY